MLSGGHFGITTHFYGQPVGLIKGEVEVSYATQEARKKAFLNQYALSFLPEESSSGVGIVDAKGYTMVAVSNRITVGVGELSLVVNQVGYLGVGRREK